MPVACTSTPRHAWAGSASDNPVSQTSNVTKWTNAVPIAGPFISGAYEDGHNQSPHYEGSGANTYTVDTAGHTEYVAAPLPDPRGG
jgi:hypothetical protein